MRTRVLNNFPTRPGALDANDRCSVIYTRFDLTGQTIPPDFVAAFRLTIRNTNFTPNRLHDTTAPNLSHRAGLSVYGLARPAGLDRIDDYLLKRARYSLGWR